MKAIDFFMPKTLPKFARVDHEGSCQFLIRTSIYLSILTLLLALQHFISGTHFAGAINLLIGLICMVNLYFFKSIGDLDFSANVVLGFSIFFLCSHLLTANQEYYAFHLVWVGGFPAFAANLLPKRETKIWTFTSLLAFATCLSLRGLGYELPLYEISGTRALVSSILSLAMSIFFMYIMVRNFREKEKAFLDKAEQIKEHKRHLEMAITYNISNYSNSIRLIAEEISNTEKDQRLKDFAGKILDKLESTESIIKNIRQEIDDNEEFKDEVKVEPIDLYQSLKDVRDLYDSRLTNKNLNLIIEIEERPPQEGYIVSADPSSLTTPILSNIISNAINYSEPSYPIYCKLRKHDEWGVLLEIRDLGSGMSKTKIESILNPLAVKNHLPEEDGKILNLATLSSYLEMIGARIYIDSRPQELYPDNHGTTIRICFQRSFADYPKAMGT